MNRYRLSETGTRPWGDWTVVALGPRFVVKRLAVRPGAHLSLQRHRRRDEHWTVVNGIAEVSLDGETRSLAENASLFIPAGAAHRLGNRGADELVVIEIQYGPDLDEADIERLADDYGRA